MISQIARGDYAPGPLDEQTGMELGLVGQETTGAGGDLLRGHPKALEIARDMEELQPRVWLINFTNPPDLSPRRY